MLYKPFNIFRPVNRLGSIYRSGLYTMLQPSSCKTETLLHQLL